MTMRKFFPFITLLLLVSFVANSQNITTFSARVVDEQKRPVAKASVHILNTDITVLTGTDGGFAIANIKEGNVAITVSAIGFATTQQSIRAGETFAPIVITLVATTNQLDDVVVTSEKRETSLQQVPASITALTSKQVTDYRLWDAKDLTAIVPNLYSNNSGDDRNVTSIRGITTTSYDPAVATYVDGVNQFSLDTYVGNLNDIERIEVLRGPQGTLYGRNATGGVINIITKKPTDKAEAFADINVGNYNMQRYMAGFRVPLVKQKLYFGASVLYSKRDGFYTNDFYNNSFDKQHNIAGNYYLKFLPSAKWSFTLNAKHQNKINNGAYPMVNGLDEAFGNAYHLSQDAVGKMSDNTVNASLQINHSGNAINFSSITAWQSNYRYYKSPVDGDFSAADGVSIVNDYGNKWNKVKVFTQEFRVSSPANNQGDLTYTAGAYFFHQNSPTKVGTHFGKDTAGYGLPDDQFTLINISTSKNIGAALFGQINYAVTKKLSFVAGLRYDYEDRKLTVAGDYQKDGTDAFNIMPDTTGKTHYNAVTPKVGAFYTLSATSNLFANYTRGFRTGGLTQASSDPLSPPLYAYKPEYSNNVEVGLKNTFFNNRLRVNITAFLSFVNDAQVPTLVLPEAITITKNTGKLTSKGAELELAATPVKGLQIDYNFGFTDAKYKSLKVAQYGSEIDLKGNKQIYTPGATSMLAAQYSIGLGENVKLVARGEWQYVGNTYYDLANTIKQNAYSLLNARLGVATKHIDIFGWCRNITDKKYIAYAYDFGAVHLADPRTYGVTVSARL